MFTRSQFLFGLVGAVVLPSAGEGAHESGKAPGAYRKVSLSVGVEKQFSVLHISDTHLAVLTEAEKAASGWRERYYTRRHEGNFRNAEKHLADAIAYASKRRMPLVHTGDLMDCPSDGNIEIVRRMIPPSSLLAAVGNHETSSRYFRGMSAKPEDLSRERTLSESRIASCWPNDGKLFAKVENEKILIPDFKCEALTPYIGKTVILGIRPEDFLPVEYRNETNCIYAKVDFCELLGAETNMYLYVGDKKVIVRMPSYEEHPVEEYIRVAVKQDRMHFFDKETEQAICH